MRPQLNQRSRQRMRQWEGEHLPLLELNSDRSAEDLVRLSGTSAITELMLAPSGTLVSSNLPCSEVAFQRHGNLAVAIRQRIESRLGNRVRELAVRVAEGTVVLSGRCATYYTKQLAQHAALGVIENEQLENEIAVDIAH